MKHIKRHPYVAVLMAAAIALILFLTLTNPSNVRVELLVIPVILLFLIAFCASYLLLKNLKRWDKQPRKRRAVAVIAASLLTVVMILQSTGGMSGADLLLMGLIITVSAIYISKF